MTNNRETMLSVRSAANVVALLGVLLVAGCTAPAAPDGCKTELLLSNHETGATVSLTETAAVGVADGAGYTVWASDFAFDEEVTTWFEPTIPDGGSVAWIALTVFSAEGEVPPLESGDRLPADAPHGEHVVVVVHRTTDRDYGQSQNATGEAVLTSVGDRICAEIDYQDDQKTLQGNVGADVTW